MKSSSSKNVRASFQILNPKDRKWYDLRKFSADIKEAITTVLVTANVNVRIEKDYIVIEASAFTKHDAKMIIRKLNTISGKRDLSSDLEFYRMK